MSLFKINELKGRFHLWWVIVNLLLLKCIKNLHRTYIYVKNNSIKTFIGKLK